MSKTSPKYLSRRQIEKIYGISSKWLANLAYEKKGPGYIKLGKKVLYPAAEFEEWLERNATRIQTQEDLYGSGAE